MKCAGCDRELKIGDRYIEDTSSGFLKREDRDDTDEAVDDIMSQIFGGSGGKVFFCEDCTEPGGDYLFETVYEDDDHEVVEGRFPE